MSILGLAYKRACLVYTLQVSIHCPLQLQQLLGWFSLVMLYILAGDMIK